VPDVALARIEILEGRNADEQRKLIDAVAAALSEAVKAPEADPSVRLLEYPPKPGSRSRTPIAIQICSRSWR